ncbi:hypothetical protein [Salibacterium halotolerans]|uniref:Uncharacterized protein n=1 Tax=Salibacterium halotolerans TaxID=1884432 RepID=A0A1I5MLI4_9BACI|nr:hypothetical protein [Salibacterium halotolerans]SFP10157.1 hypothetical protein SAMN05518683_102269 [Salibacterium halotolerans]
MKYAIVLDSFIMEKFDTPEEAYDEGRSAYEESGLFHEIKLVSDSAKTIND